MNKNPKSYSFFSGRLVITANAFHRLNLCDVYRAFFRHARAEYIELCPADEPGEEPSVKVRRRYMTTHLDRHGTPFWILTQAALTRTTVCLR